MVPVAAEKIRDILLGGQHHFIQGQEGGSVLFERTLRGDFCIFEVLNSWVFDHTPELMPIWLESL